MTKKLTRIPSRSLEEYEWTSFPFSLLLYLIIAYNSQQLLVKGALTNNNTELRQDAFTVPVAE